MFLRWKFRTCYEEDAKVGRSAVRVTAISPVSVLRISLFWQLNENFALVVTDLQPESSSRLLLVEFRYLFHTKLNEVFQYEKK